jgi:hypothetical protein
MEKIIHGTEEFYKTRYLELLEENEKLKKEILLLKMMITQMWGE